MKESDIQNEQKSDLPESPRKSFSLAPSAVRGKIKGALERRKEKLANEDPIFVEPITPEEPPKAQPLVKGNVDVWFLLWAMILICFGAIMSYSASAVYAEQKYDDSTYFLLRYVLFAVAAIVVTLPFVMLARPWFWRIFSVLAYGGAIVLLLLVLVMGAVRGGAQRWIDLGFVTVQPSEIAKTAVVMLLALYMSKYEKEITSKHLFGGSFRKGVLMPMCIIGTVCVLVALERHISGLMIIGMLGVCVMFLGGTRVKWLAMFLALIAVAGVFLILVSDYAQERVDIWINIDKADPLGSAWQTLQGLYAIGSGGFFGLGLGSSRQKFGYVSQPQNDFIFTIICEELGFIGAFALLLLFGLLIWRGIKIGQRAPDKFCALTVWGLTFKIALQVAMNIAVVTNTMPNTGISLPFFSSGGTSLMLQIFEIGIILSISRFSTSKK
ncbi:MAG: cell division protein FtsW [Ruminococcaceae bacterium]|nr:cell division protein FtsW [Oscillospiraceae bacterium]